MRQFPARDGFSVGRVQLAKEYSQSRDAVGTGFLKNALDALSELDLSSEQFAGMGVLHRRIEYLGNGMMKSFSGSLQNLPDAEKVITLSAWNT